MMQTLAAQIVEAVLDALNGAEWRFDWDSDADYGATRDELCRLVEQILARGGVAPP